MSKKSWFLAVLVATLALVCGMSAWGGKPAGGGKPPAPSYRILELDLENSYVRSGASDITSPSAGTTLRQVVGYVAQDDTPESVRPACWTVSVLDGNAQSQLQLLALPAGATVGAAEGINQHGEIVGAADLNGQMRGFHWADSGASAEVLPPLPGDTGSYAYAVNKDGVICGLSELAIPGEDENGDPTIDYEYRAIVWLASLSGDIVGPVQLPDFGNSFALAISDNDDLGYADVVGGQYSADGAAAWTVYSNRVTGELEAGTQTVILNEVGGAYGVNDSSTVCGEAETSDFLSRAVVWTGVGTNNITQTVLKRANFYMTWYANDINNSGVIVGVAEYTKHFAQYQAVLWPSANESMVSLNKFLDDSVPFSCLQTAWAINDFGEIVGKGYDLPDGDGRHRAFLAIPQ